MHTTQTNTRAHTHTHTLACMHTDTLYTQARLMSGEINTLFFFIFFSRTQVVTGDLHLVVQFANYAPKG